MGRDTHDERERHKMTQQVFTIWIVTPSPQYIHSRCFEEVAIALNDGLIELGHKSKIVTSSFECRGRTIVMGSHLITGMHVKDLPEDIIFYNLEQFGSTWMTKEYINLLRGMHNGRWIKESGRKYEVWDYSKKNIDELSKLKISAKLCEIGYSKVLTKINNTEKSIDILFIGSINDRRKKVHDELVKNGVNVRFIFGIYGEHRDALIASSRIIINIHFYEAKVFEIVRCSYLMANKVCIVSETGSDEQLEVPFRGGIEFSPYDKLVDTCVELLKDNDRIKSIGQKGYEIFSQMKQSEMLKKCL